MDSETVFDLIKPDIESAAIAASRLPNFSDVPAFQEHIKNLLRFLEQHPYHSVSAVRGERVYIDSRMENGAQIMMPRVTVQSYQQELHERLEFLLRRANDVPLIEHYNIKPHIERAIALFQKSANIRFGFGGEETDQMCEAVLARLVHSGRFCVHYRNGVYWKKQLDERMENWPPKHLKETDVYDMLVLGGSCGFPHKYMWSRYPDGPIRFPEDCTAAVRMMPMHYCRRWTLEEKERHFNNKEAIEKAFPGAHIETQIGLSPNGIPEEGIPTEDGGRLTKENCMGPTDWPGNGQPVTPQNISMSGSSPVFTHYLMPNIPEQHERLYKIVYVVSGTNAEPWEGGGHLLLEMYAPESLAHMLYTQLQKHPEIMRTLLRQEFSDVMRDQEPRMPKREKLLLFPQESSENVRGPLPSEFVEYDDNDQIIHVQGSQIIAPKESSVPKPIITGEAAVLTGAV